MHTRAYRDGTIIASDFPFAELSDHLDAGCVLWVDLSHPQVADLQLIASELGLHELAIEDAASTHQRPKLDHYETHRFLSCHAVRFEAATHELVETEIAVFVGDRWMITVRKSDDFDIERVVNRWNNSSQLAEHGVSFLLYGLLDVVVDDYFDVLGELDGFYDTVSEGIFEERPLNPEQQRDWFKARQALLRFHRLTLPLREVVSSLMRRDQGLVAPPLYPYFQDVYDHLIRVNEDTDLLPRVGVVDHRDESVVA